MTLQVRFHKAQSITPLSEEACFDLGGGLRVEWKRGVFAVAPDGLSAQMVEEPETGLTLCRIAGQNLGTWLRLHLDLPTAAGRLLGLRFLIRASAGSAASRIKPFLVASRTDNGSRKELPGLQPRQIALAAGQWYEVSGLFACSDLSDPRKIDAVLDLPKNAVVDLAGIDICLIDLETSAEAAAARDQNGATVIAGFLAAPVADIARALQDEPVFAAYATQVGDQIQGGILTAASTILRDEPGNPGGIPVALDQEVAVAPGFVVTRGFGLPAGVGPAGLRIAGGSGSEIRFAPVQDLIAALEYNRALQIQQSVIRDFRLHLSGQVRNLKWPGMPVRLRINLAGTEIGTILASAALEGDDVGAFEFHVDQAVPERLQGGALEIEVLDGRQGPPYRIPVTLVASGASAAELDAPRDALPPDAEVVGYVEGLSREMIQGWAVAPAFPDHPVELALYLNDRPVAYTKTRAYRKDVQKIHGGTGFNGFSFELPANLAVGDDVTLEVRPIGAQGELNKAVSVLQVGGGLCEASPLPTVLRPAPTGTGTPTIPADARLSLIILNRNGRDLLAEMFASVQPEDRNDGIEWIVVDHDSADDSEAVCEDFRASGARLTFLRRRGNYSFSESNNFGARHATGQVLIFANNDLLFPQAFGATIRRYMADPGIGALGVRLLDHIDSPAGAGLSIDQHRGVFFETALNRSDWIRPYEARRGLETPDEPASRAAAVTGAFMAMRRQDFEAAGAFDEGYSYGLEDVDLCLKVRAHLGLEVVCANDLAVIHHRGFSRQKDPHSGLRRRHNNELFNRRWGQWLRQTIKRDVLTDHALWTGRRPVVAFIVSEAGDMTSAGEYYTSLELGRALQKRLACHVRYLPKEDWYDLSGVDLVVAMVNRFDITKVRQASPWLVAVNWMRQWFDRWAEGETTLAYDHLFASSGTAARYLEDHLKRAVGTLPIAAGVEAMRAGHFRQDLASDYCFTGSRFGPPREIEFQLAPETIRGQGRVFGYNWEGTQLEPLSQGPLAYSEIPDAYASTRIVLDDANIATKAWGSCNSRVFDSMAAGALLITNGATGVQELFGDLVPTFDSRESLTEVVNYWLAHRDERRARVLQLQNLVLREHSYDRRAQHLLETLAQQGRPLRIAIKSAAKEAERAQWGDYHFAESLAAALRRLGHVVRVDCRERWHCGLAASDDAVIVLRGLIAYKPRLHQLNILWLISHPDDVTQSELRGYDHVYVASEKHTAILARDLGIEASFLPQCTDTGRFAFASGAQITHPERNLYVANSRGIFRDPVRWSVQNELPIDIYGVGWEPFITDARYRGQLVPNEVLGELYAASRLVICDHWEDMRKLGYVSNRVFDVLACGGRLITDRVEGIEDLVPAGFVAFFDDEASFAALLREDNPPDEDQRRRAADWVRAHHSFDARAREIAGRIAELFATGFRQQQDRAGIVK